MKAEKIALIDNQIKRELLERLKQGSYGNLYTFRKETFKDAIEKEQEIIEEEAAELPPAFEADDYEEEDAGDMEDLSSFMAEDDEEEFDFYSDEFASETGDTEENNSPPEKRQRTTSKETPPSTPNNSRSRSPRVPKRKRIHREIEYEKTTERQRQTNF